MRSRTGLAAFAASTACGLGLPAVASAHGIVGRQDLPIPRWLFAWAAAVVLIVSFVALATLWPKPRLESTGTEGRRLFVLPRLLGPLAGLIGVALFGLVVYVGLEGNQEATSNLAPTFVGVLFWVGMPILCLLLGDVFRPLNPWRAIGRGVGWTAKRILGDGMPAPLPYPEKLGRWPAALGIGLFAWFELVWSGLSSPQDVAIASCVYLAAMLVGMAVYGVEAWCRNADGFGVYFDLVGRIGPLQWRGREGWARRPLSGLTAIAVVPGTVALLVVLIGTTSFDGFTQGPTWNAVAPDLKDAFTSLGLSGLDGLRAALTVGMVGVLAAIAVLYRAGAAGMRSVDGKGDVGRLSRRFVHTLVPIAAAYVVAHYFSYLFNEGQRGIYLASDPLGDGSNYFGTAATAVDYDILSANAIWYIQVAALVAGHVGGLVLAHDRALSTWSQARDAARSQYWMLAVMVGYTSLGLWLLSAQAAG